MVVPIVLLALAIAAVSLVAGIAPRELSGRLTDGQRAALRGVASGVLLATALLVLVPEGFHTANSAGGWINHSGAEQEQESSGAGTHDADITELAFEPAIDPALLGLVVLAGVVVMIVFNGSGFGQEGHQMGVAGLAVQSVGTGLAISSAGVAGGWVFSLLVTFAVLIQHLPLAFGLGATAVRRDDSPLAVRGPLAFALATPVVMVITYVVLRNLNNDRVAMVLLFSAGTFLHIALVDALAPTDGSAASRGSLRNVLVGVTLFTALFFVVRTFGALDHVH